MGCCQSATVGKEEEDDEQAEQPIDIRFSATSADGTERNTRSTVRPSQPRTSNDLGGPAPFTGRHGSSRGAPSPSLSSVSLVPVARTGSYDVRVASRTRQNGGDGVIETSRLVVDHLKGNVFINQYLIIKDLGKGAHGTVKLVYNTQDDMLYAMKVIHKRRMRRQSYLAEPRAVANMMRNVGMSPLSGSQTEGQRGPSPLSSPRTPNGMTDEYSNEIAVMKELDHPNVVKLYEVIHDPSNNKLLMTMEYVEGGCVLAGSSPTQKVPIPEATAVKYFRDVVKGLEYLHFNRIVHGDLKPDNLLMSSSGKVKISDFGSARFCEKSDMIFATAGTPSFMAPEMCQGKQFNGFPGDIWALGICLFMFVFGKPPFTGNTTYQIYEAIQRGELQFPAEIPASGELKDLLTRLLQKDPAQRISLEEIPAHPWVTRGGVLPVLQTSNERAVQRVFEAMRKRNESGAKRPAPSTVPLAAPPEPVDMRKLVPDAEVRHFRDREVIIAQGQLPEGLYYVQEGFIDMMLMPSEKKLVADADFADAIDDEDDEEDEAVVTATANALDCGGSPGSAKAGEGEEGSEGEEAGEEEARNTPAECEDDGPKPMDGFMALFGSRLSDRVSPMGSSSVLSPRNPSTVVTSRHGSQTITMRNHSATVTQRYGSQSSGLQRTSNAQVESPGRTSNNASASMPLPPPLSSQHSLSMPSSYHHHMPAHLAQVGQGGASRLQGLNPQSRSPSNVSPSASSPVTTNSGAPTSRNDSPTTTNFVRYPAVAPMMSIGGAAGSTGPTVVGLTSQYNASQAMAGRISFNGSPLQTRVPSYTGMGAMLGMGTSNASINPSPLGLSCSNAADLDESGDGSSNQRKDAAALGSGVGGIAGKSGSSSHRLMGSGKDPVQAQPPFLVPSPPHTSPQASRRALVQEPSFNQRYPRHEGVQRPPSRLSLTDSASAGPASAPGRIALQGRTTSKRARSPLEPEDGGQADGTGPMPCDGGGDGGGSAVNGSSSRRLSSARGVPGSKGVVSMPQVSMLSSSPQAGTVASSEKEDLLFLTPVESRRLSVTAGGAASFRRLGGAGVIVGASPPSGLPGSVSPAISRVHSNEHSSRPWLPPAVEEALADASGDSGKASNDTINSNADISIHAPNRTGWRLERPSPLQISGAGNGALPGGISEQASGDSGGAAAAAASHLVGSASGGAGPPTPPPILPEAQSVRRIRSAMRRSATHDNIMHPSCRSVLLPGGAIIVSGGGPPAGPDASQLEDDETSAVTYDGVERHQQEHGGSCLSVRHAITDVERPMQRVRMRRHSTSSYNASFVLKRVLGVSMSGASLDRTSIQEWSTTSKLAQKAIQRSDSMHSRMAQMVLRAKQHAVRRERRGSMQLITTRGPGSVVGELCIDGKPAPSPSTVVAKGPVTVLLIKNEKVNKYRNQPSVMAALHRSQNASLVQEAMERFVECEGEVVAVEVIRRTITTEPNMHLEVAEEEYTGEHHSSERLMADIYNG
ncbi:hypothetical protein Vretifemale_5833 [Volvox reticuliferus]|uniref:Protein kinase domain-containing protein n=1 Tax=Volvox reticuliferus TaxID=1737510 RepID=A0A8J4C7C1_9CHLO|nr:hypothetical protein Vretifemale_5833 [Volvox reticuliferus]